MTWFRANQDVTIQIPFGVSGEFVDPDVNSVRVSVYDSLGNALTTPEFFPVPALGSTTSGVRYQSVDPLGVGPAGASYDDPTASSAVVVIPSEMNIIGATDDLQSRFIVVSYAVRGLNQTYSYSYNLRPFLPITVKASDVRALVGAQESELPDADIEIYGSYYKLLFSEGAILKTALASSNLAAIHANVCIALVAAIHAHPALQTKLLKEETNSNSTVQRFRVDFEKLKQDLQEDLENNLTMMRVIVTGDQGQIQTYPIFLVVTPTDKITGH